MVRIELADLIYRLRAARKAFGSFPDFAGNPDAQALDRSLKRYLPLAGFLRAGLDVLAALSGTDKYGQHFYTRVYADFAKAQRRKPVSLLEIGVGGYSGSLGGESLLMWAEYFRKGRIYAIDVLDKTALTRGRIKVFHCSQVDRERLTAIAREVGPFDFVIDDGSHMNGHQIETFRILWPFVKDGGVYVVEDVQTSYWPYFGGGVLGSPAYQRSCMNFFKALADSVNLCEFLAPPGPDAILESAIGSIAFHHNLIVITKDLGERVSNVAVDQEPVRTALMQPAQSAET